MDDWEILMSTMVAVLILFFVVLVVFGWSLSKDKNKSGYRIVTSTNREGVYSLQVYRKYPSWCTVYESNDLEAVKKVRDLMEKPAFTEVK